MRKAAPYTLSIQPIVDQPPIDLDHIAVQIANGDKVAFKLLYDLYWQQLYAVALQWLKASWKAQDVVQEVYYKIWQRREKLLDVRDLKAYMIVMARNEIFSTLKASVTTQVSVEQIPDVLADNSSCPDQTLRLKHAEASILEAVQNLPPRQQQIFRLTRMEGLSHEEIARRLGVSKETVSNHATRALLTLRKSLIDAL
jgi:RNA polymerase sigma-70 factor (family 1)